MIGMYSEIRRNKQWNQRDTQPKNERANNEKEQLILKSKFSFCSRRYLFVERIHKIT